MLPSSPAHLLLSVHITYAQIRAKIKVIQHRRSNSEMTKVFKIRSILYKITALGARRRYELSVKLRLPNESSLPNTLRRKPSAFFTVSLPLLYRSAYLRFLVQSLLRISCVSLVHPLRIFCVSSLSRSTCAVHANSHFAHTISHQIKLTLSMIGTKSSKSDYQ